MGSKAKKYFLGIQMLKKKCERPEGISAYIIVNNNTEWLGPSIESILPLCDEILVVERAENSEAKKIVANFTSNKVNMLDNADIYLFNCPSELIFIECRNLAIKNTKYNTIFEWDANFLMLQEYVSDDMYNTMIENDALKFRGYAMASKKLNMVSEEPYTKIRERSWKYEKNNLITKLKSKKIKDPIYLDTTNIGTIKKKKKIDIELPIFFFKKEEEYLSK
jgi:hypothetical protein